MSEIRVTPETAQKVVDDAVPGQTLVFSPGRYTKPLHITNKHGITLRAEKGAVFTAESYDFETARLEANLIAQKRQQEGKFPSLHGMIDQARIKLSNSSQIVIEGFTIEKSWPTHIFMDESQNITLRNLKMEDGTYAIYAKGESTRDILIDRVSWTQDPTRRMWSDVPWFRIHGNPPEYSEVDVTKDYRIYDGQFFHADNIAGHVTLRNCAVSDAFNVLRMTRRGENAAQLSRHVTVSDCRFTRIRDNVIEPEEGGRDWVVKNCLFLNTYKAIALESGLSNAYQNFEISGNTFLNTTRPGPQGDQNSTQTIFKVPSPNVNPLTKSEIRFFDNDINGIPLFSAKYQGMFPENYGIQIRHDPMNEIITDYPDMPPSTPLRLYANKHVPTMLG